MYLAKTFRRSHILAVDDTPDNLILIKAILEDEGYEITLAADGMTALQIVEQSLPDLILLDVMMPGIDGYEVTRRIRQNPDLPFIPILLITAYDQSSVVEGLDAGAEDFVRKPFNTDELLARVRSLLRLKCSIDELEEMSRQREDFVSRLTHDLRTPLVAADRMTKLIQQEAFGEISPEMREAIGIMIRSNHNLLQMVNTLLEVYRYDAGHKTLSAAPCNLRDITQEVIQELDLLAQEKGLRLIVNYGESGDDRSSVVMGDHQELWRVMTNLIGNAIKFTDVGSITVRILETSASTYDGGSSQANWITVEVEDTGSGISQEDQTYLFERFRKSKHRRAGSGLGLHLSRRIIESHGGNIEVSSEVGKGSVFTVRLPKQP
jgi:signal transduction histidine kinase